MKVVCPNCRKMTRINKEKGAVYCQYCGEKFVDDKSDYEIRKNITVNKHYYDEAKIKQIEYNQKKDKKKEKR